MVAPAKTAYAKSTICTLCFAYAKSRAEPDNFAYAIRAINIIVFAHAKNLWEPARITRAKSTICTLFLAYAIRIKCFTDFACVKLAKRLSELHMQIVLFIACVHMSLRLPELHM